jgi:hypothetical protein
MPNLSEYVLEAFRLELRKESAVIPQLGANASRVLRNTGSLGGVGMLAGGAVGAGLGAVGQYRDARSQGGTVGESLAHGLGGVVHGGLTGAVMGGLAGAGAGALAKGSLASLGEREGAIGAASRFGQRQVHGFTGMLTPAELKSTGVRGGAHDAERALEALKKNPDAPAGAVEKAEGMLEKSHAATGVADPTMNLTSLPGYARAVQTHGVLKPLKTGLRDQMAAHPIAGAAMVGAPLAMGALSAAGPAVDEQGRGRGERIGQAAGETVGGLAAGAMPLVSGNLMAAGVGRMGKYVGRGVDKLRGKGGEHTVVGQPGMSPVTSLEPTESQNTPSERVTSPSAAGQQKDVGI